jgi:predicted nucleic acid-binding protein
VKPVFGDTVYFLALVNARDQLHPQAKELSREPPGSLVTTEWVLTEVGDALSAPGAREKFISLLGALQRQSDVETIRTGTFVARSDAKSSGGSGSASDGSGGMGLIEVDHSDDPSR